MRLMLGNDKRSGFRSARPGTPCGSPHGNRQARPQCVASGESGGPVACEPRGPILGIRSRRRSDEHYPTGPGTKHPARRLPLNDGFSPCAEFDGQGNLTHRYLYGPAVDMIMASLSVSGQIAWDLADHLGSVRDRANTSGQVIDHIAYNSFGGVLSETNPSAGDRFKFTAREFDAVTGEYYFRARYYDAAIGRFLSEDPIGFQAGDANLYRYVRNHPIGATDPSGLEEFKPSEQIDTGWQDIGAPQTDATLISAWWVTVHGWRVTVNEVVTNADGTRDLYRVTYRVPWHRYRQSEYSVSQVRRRLSQWR